MGAQMTEPTQEQIEAERERAHAIVAVSYRLFGWGMAEMGYAQEALATALARRALDARDEALKEAERICAADCRHCDCADAIRALRDGAR
jgi:hypothetical protein